MSEYDPESIRRLISDGRARQLDRAVDQIEALSAERDRFRSALEMIAIPPVHVPDLSEGCEGCAGVARAALDGTDFRGRVSTTMEGVVAREAVVAAAQRWYEASDMDELQHAVVALKAAVKALNIREGT